MTAIPSHASCNQVRFRPDPLDFAELDFGATDAPFSAQLVALIAEESPMGGVGLAMLMTRRIQKGVVLRVKVGRLAPLLSEVRWVRMLEGDLIRVGIKFLE